MPHEKCLLIHTPNIYRYSVSEEESKPHLYDLEHMPSAFVGFGY